MKILSLCILCVHVSFGAGDWGIVTGESTPETKAQAHIRLSNRASNFVEKLWHLRRSLMWQATPNAQKKLGDLTKQDQSHITNNSDERSELLILIPKTQDLWLKQRRIISLYQLCAYIGFDNCPLDIFQTPHKLAHPFEGLIRFQQPAPPDFRIATFGSCLSQRTANALLHILGLPLDETHYDLCVQFCRTDYIKKVIIKQDSTLLYEYVGPLLKSSKHTQSIHVVKQEFPEESMGCRSLHPLRMWDTVLLTKKPLWEKLRTQNPQIIFLDNFADLKHLHSIHKETGYKLFLRREWVKDYDQHFVLEDQKIPISESVDNFYRIIDHFHTLWPKAHIIFFHFPSNIDPNPRVQERYSTFKEAFVPPDYVTVLDVPVTDKDTTDGVTHFTPWYHEKLARMAWQSIQVQADGD